MGKPDPFFRGSGQVPAPEVTIVDEARAKGQSRRFRPQPDFKIVFDVPLLSRKSNRKNPPRIFKTPGDIGMMRWHNAMTFPRLVNRTLFMNREMEAWFRLKIS